MNDNFEIFLEQVKIYQEIERRRKFKVYALTFGVFSFIMLTLYCFFYWKVIMSTFIEVTSTAPKACKLIINLDCIIEIAPLVQGGCVLYFSTLEAGGPRTITVADSYQQFMQFAMQTVSSEDIAKRFPSNNKPKRPMSTSDTIKPGGTGVEFSNNVHGE